MCLGVPGQVVSRAPGELAMGTVAFGSVQKQICLAYVPEAKVGDYVIVHAGFAIRVLDPEQASEVFDYLARAEDG